MNIMVSILIKRNHEPRRLSQDVQLGGFTLKEDVLLTFTKVIYKSA
jgi:hypothetical protein